MTQDAKSAELECLVVRYFGTNFRGHAWSIATWIRLYIAETKLRVAPWAREIQGEELEPFLVELHRKGVVLRVKAHGGEPMYELVRRPPRPVRVGVDWRGNRWRPNR